MYEILISKKKSSPIAIFLQSSCIMIRRITIRNMDKESIMKIPVPAGAIPVLYMRNGSIQEKKRILCVKFQSRSGSYSRSTYACDVIPQDGFNSAPDGPPSIIDIPLDSNTKLSFPAHLPNTTDPAASVSYGNVI